MLTQDDFILCLEFVLAREGGYVDHPKDPGGATNLGITIPTLSNFRGKTVTKEDIKNLTRDEAAKIYKKNYWDQCKCDSLPLPVAALVFDCAVNSGNFRSVSLLQAAVGVYADGKIGDITISAVGRFNVKETVGKAIEARHAFLKRLSTYETFGKGWKNRLDLLTDFCKHLEGKK